MQLQLEPFLNACTSMDVSFLQWLGDLDKQSAQFNKNKTVFDTYELLMERFFEHCEFILSTKEYHHFRDIPFLITLKKLSKQLEAHYEETILRSDLTENDLFKNAKWIEIRGLALEAHREFEIFKTLLVKEIEDGPQS